ncbi:MAG: aldehyde dehydrogenase family protein [Planctomycetes bacterium]|nr:aldehyde dehydrogenase family protein [Planctomycetota bacterium]
MIESFDVIAGNRVALSGSGVQSRNPADLEEVLWQADPVLSHVDEAVTCAALAQRTWAAADPSDREGILRRFAEITAERADSLAKIIRLEVGKTKSESAAEAGALAAKVKITIEGPGAARVRPFELAVTDTRTGQCRFKPHGVMAVIGPFNFPMHLPNGQIAPALLAGNAVVFKPSEQAPACGQALVECLLDAGIPPGVVSLVHGEAAAARRLVEHNGVDGVLFTGSWAVGRSILEATLDDPGRIVALELGGNNPAIIMPDADVAQAVIECVRAAFATAGQRCTCTRRIIVHRDIASQFIPALATCASTLLVGDPSSNEPIFMGPMISAAARDRVLDAQSRLLRAGAKIIVPCSQLDSPGAMLTAGVAEVDSFIDGSDEEVFGPLVQVCVVNSLDEALREAAATRYGLAAAIFSRDRSVFERAMQELKVGCLNWNNGTAGASSALPFGGVGCSGNHRPAAAFAPDFCVFPVASLMETGSESVVPEGMQWDDRWLGDA